MVWERQLGPANHLYSKSPQRENGLIEVHLCVRTEECWNIIIIIIIINVSLSFFFWWFRQVPT